MRLVIPYCPPHLSAREDKPRQSRQLERQVVAGRRRRSPTLSLSPSQSYSGSDCGSVNSDPERDLENVPLFQWNFSLGLGTPVVVLLREKRNMQGAGNRQEAGILHPASSKKVFRAGSRDPGPGIQEPESGTQEPESGIRNPGSGSRETCSRQQCTCCTHAQGCPGSQEPGPGIRDPGAGIRNPGAGTREPGAGQQAVRHL